MQTGILRPLTELLFTVFPMFGTLQMFEAAAAVLNWIASLIGVDILFVGL